MNQKIQVWISPNETNTPARIADLMKAIGASGYCEYAGKDPKQPADICMRIPEKRIHIEVKDTQKSNDVWGSMKGHLGDQLVKLLDEHSEAFVVVMATYPECLSEVPEFTREGKQTRWAGKALRESNKTTLRAMNADAYGCEIPIFYFSKDRVLSFKEMLSYGKARLLGGNPFQWASSHRGKARKIMALTGNGIGYKNASALLEHFGSIRAIALAGYDDLKKVPGIGPERALSIMELMT